MKYIELTQGFEAIVDDVDYEELYRYSWSAQKTRNVNRVYARGSQKGHLIYMHRAILQPKAHEICDHINRNGLDNRRVNLRIVSKSGNLMNTGVHKDNKSGVKGVSFYKKRQKWIAFIYAHNRSHFLGYFSTLEQAKTARLDAEKVYHSEIQI